MPPNDRPPQLAYEPPQAITRGGFRMMLFLMFVNTLLLGLFVVGPGLQNFIKEQWAEWKQQKVALAAATQAAASAAASQKQRTAAIVKRDALKAEAIAYLAPPGKLIYDDSPAAATRPATNPTNAAEWPGVSAPPECFQQLSLVAPSYNFSRAYRGVPLLIHSLKATPNSAPMLVIVWADPRSVTLPQGSAGYGDRRWTAISFSLSPAQIQAGSRLTQTEFSWSPPEPRTPRRDPTKPPAPPPPPPPEPALRMFAAEVDPSAGGVFTIPYDINGRRGILTGRLSASGLVGLTPDAPIKDGWRESSTTNYQ